MGLEQRGLEHSERLRCLSFVEHRHTQCPAETQHRQQFKRFNSSGKGAKEVGDRESSSREEEKGKVDNASPALPQSN